ncbi:hypothetical protein GKE82_25470 [Conexibacter sp. W3-3-2]|uniref:hypothetical protein n=1 Tax=Conexibacter sp. W3-3-2 TaxID=2675227 RepID=UPI0012B8ACF8|nr:hypothetical protein [Conexibacter sp. W3-3-2]MTD47419.1 hypothetical protein [Conexibacter sp. W3-3-2]MTD47558.1 hypothetical protein [Conexibacter sp. W3-3-2]
MLYPVLAGILIAALAGLFARLMVPEPKPPRAAAVLAGFLGMLSGAPIAHKISADHEFHAFRPESTIAAVAGAYVLLVLLRLVIRRFGASEERRLFS